MLGRTFYLALLIALAVQVVEVQSTVAALSSVCNKAEECYVDETSSSSCNRLEKKCNQCLIEKENDSVFSVLSKTEYICYQVDDNGACPIGTTKCPTRLKTSTDDRDQEQEGDNHSSNISYKTTPTFTSTEKKLVSSSSESETPIQSISSSVEATLMPIKKSSTEKKNTSLLSTTDSSGDTPTTETPKKPMLKKTATSNVKSSPLLASEEEVAEETSISDYFSSSLHDDAASAAEEELNSPLPDSAGTHEAKMGENSPDQSRITPEAPTPTTPIISKSITKDTVLSNAGGSATTSAADSKSGGSTMSLILCIGLGVAAVVGFAGFVVWKKTAADDDSDDGDSAYSPTKPAMSRNVVSQPSASSATTAYLAQPYGNNNYERQYSNNYGNNYGGDNGYSNKKHTVARYVAGSSAGSAARMVPPSYGSPCSIDIDGDYDSRRTDSILGGTGVMLSTKSGMYFSAGQSPTNSDSNQDIWGNERGSVSQKCTASSASVEF